MSWSVKATKQASPSAVALAVTRDPSVPGGMRDYLLQVIGNLAPLAEGETFDLETNGHVDDRGADGRFSIRRVVAKPEK